MFTYQQLLAFYKYKIKPVKSPSSIHYYGKKAKEKKKNVIIVTDTFLGQWIYFFSPYPTRRDWGQSAGAATEVAP